MRLYEAFGGDFLMLVFDRTLEDVELAKKIINEKVKSFEALTEEELSILERGTLTINTINRIEATQKEIRETLNSMFYFVENFENREWEYGQYFKKEDIDRIISNNEKLKSAYYTKPDTPSAPTANYYFQTINDIEKILYDIKDIISSSVENYKICGDAYCGGD